MKLYWHRRTRQPKNCEELGIMSYHIRSGLAGFKKQQPDRLIFYGSFDEFKASGKMERENYTFKQSSPAKNHSLAATNKTPRI